MRYSQWDLYLLKLVAKMIEKIFFVPIWGFNNPYRNFVSLYWRRDFWPVTHFKAVLPFFDNNFWISAIVITEYRDAFTEPYQTCKMKLFVMIVNGWKSLTVFARSSTWDVWQGSEYISDSCYRILDCAEINGTIGFS